MTRSRVTKILVPRLLAGGALVATFVAAGASAGYAEEVVAEPTPTPIPDPTLVTVTNPFDGVVVVDVRQFNVLIICQLILVILALATFVWHASAPIRLKGRNRVL